jgi:hypothetical protein
MADNGYGWDDEVATTDEGFSILEEGDYTFKVVDFERGRVKKGKNAGANQAIYTLMVTGTDGTTIERKYFIPLVDSLRWKATKFFKSVGAIDADSHGESVRFPWGEVVGMSGRCHVIKTKWTGDDGEERDQNDISACLVGDEVTPTKKKAVDDIDYGDL